MSADDTTSTPLPDLLEREITRVTTEARTLWERRSEWSRHDERVIHGLWEYEKRLRFLEVFTAMAYPDQPTDQACLERIETRFRRAVTGYGSATEDNIRAADAISLRVMRSEQGASELSLQLGSSAIPVADLMLHLCDIVGTAKFYNEHLRGIAELRQLNPELWEHAYRVIMLTVCALFSSPRHQEPDHGSTSE